MQNLSCGKIWREKSTICLAFPNIIVKCPFSTEKLIIINKKKFTRERREDFLDPDIGLPVTYRQVATPPAAQPAIVEQDQAVQVEQPLHSTGGWRGQGQN